MPSPSSADQTTCFVAENSSGSGFFDVEMPVLNGFELCERLRAVPSYEKTPVIFVTIHSDFESRAKSSLSGGDDLIAKPILPMELAAKVVMHLLKSQTPR